MPPTARPCSVPEVDGGAAPQRHLRRLEQPGLRRGPDRRQRCRDARPAVRPRCFAPSGLGPTFSFEQEWDQAMPMFQPVGGMDQLPRALADAVRGPIRYGAKVTRIEVGADGVSVDYTDGSGTAKRPPGRRTPCAPSRPRCWPGSSPTWRRRHVGDRRGPDPPGREDGAGVRPTLLGGRRPDPRGRHRDQPRHRQHPVPVVRVPRRGRRSRDRLLHLRRRGGGTRGDVARRS